VQGAETLLARAKQLRLRNATTAVVRVRSKRPAADGSYPEEVWVTTSRNKRPSEWKVPGRGLQDGERYIPPKQDSTHAEQDIVAALGDDWVIVEGASNVNICKDRCLPALENIPGLKIGGSPQRTTKPDEYSPWRTFWSEE
jgi:hypothetical protein